MALSYLFDPNTQFQNKNGVNNVGGYLYVFINDSDDHAPTYRNFTGTLNPERIVLDNNGRAVVIVDELKTYRIEVYDRSGNMLWSQYPVRPTNVIYGDYNVYNADINGTPNEIDVDVEQSASGVKKFTIKLANAVKTVIGNIQDTISSIVETISTKKDKQQPYSVSGNATKTVKSVSQNANGDVSVEFENIEFPQQVQSDWNQADSSKVDYIKNKPNLGLKADKVQGATAGNLAALDANGNLTDSGSKAADFKTKQTPVPDPSASGAGLEFIDTASQDTNGVMTLHKKAVQDGTTSQKGVVQLQDSIGSTESATDKAVTPHAVREAINAVVSSAYHAAGTKSVAQLTSSLLVAENEGCVYNITDSGTTTSDFVDGAGHPINAGDNVGVCDVGGGVYKFDLLSGFVDLTNYLTKTGDASNTTATFTKASGDTSTMASGGKLSAIFTAISSFFASLKALAFKDKASYNDLSSGVQSSLDKADSALQSHQSVTDNNPTLAWGSTSTIGKVGSTDLRVTMPSNPASYKVPFINIDSTLASLDLNTLTTQGFYYCPGFVSDSVVLSNIPSELNNSTKSWRLEVINQRSRVEQILVDASDNGQDATRVMGIWKRHRFSDGTNWTPWVNMRDASWINSGTFNTDRIADDAITADKVKDNETLPVNISGKADSSFTLIGKNMVSGTNGYSLLATLELSNINAVYAGAMFAVVSRGGSACVEGIVSVSLSEYTNAGNETAPIVGNVVVMNCRGANLEALTSKFDFYMLRIEAGKYQLYVHKKESGLPVSCTLLAATECTCTLYSSGAVANLPSSIETKKLDWICNKGVGSPSIPVYVGSDGQVQPCNPSQMGVGAASYAEAVNLAKNSDSTNGDYIYVGFGTGQRIGNAGNAKKWDSWKIAVDEFGTATDTIYFY